MAHSPINTAYPDSPEDREAISKMTNVEQIKEYYRDKKIADGTLVPDWLNPSVLHLAEQPAAQPLSVTVTVNGQNTTFTGVDQADIDRQQVAFFRAAFSGEHADATNNAPVVRTSDGRFARSEASPSPITAAANKIANTVVNDALAAEGISIEDLRELAAGKQQDRSVVTDWSIAAERFKAGPGADWPGGEDYREALGQTIGLLGLADATDKVAALSQAWEYMKQSIKQNEDVANARTPQEMREALGITERERMRVRNGNPW